MASPRKKPPSSGKKPGDPWQVLAAPFWEAVDRSGISAEARAKLLQGLLLQWRADCHAKLRQADLDDEHVELAEVFVDLAVSEDADVASAAENSPVQERGALMRLLAEEWPTRAGCSPDEDEPVVRDDPGAVTTVVLLGGPGQGKSTVGQFLFLLHAGIILRTARVEGLLEERDQERITRALDALARIGVKPPKVLRLPLRFELRFLATAPTVRDTRTPPSLALLAAFEHAWNIPMCDAKDLHAVCRSAPWVLILDGLDEVPALEARGSISRVLGGFRDSLRGTHGVVLGSSRPQGYEREVFERKPPEWHLLSLHLERARSFGYRLAEVWHHERPRELNLLRARIDESLRDATTAAMMRSPLQVTIMALLVERKGKAPGRRWTLFHEYYGIIYNRELNRGTAFSELLKEHGPQLRRVHAQAALCLQALSEDTQGTSALMSSDALRVLIERVLVDDGVPQDDARTLAGRLLDACAQRLVFLTRKRGDLFGFELRSLQEFFAAQAITTGRDEQVERRLRHLGPIVSWRNVYLFAISRQFDADAPPEVRRERVAGVCRWLDEESEDLLLAVSRAGARLALDILADDPFGSQSIERNELIRRALRLLDLPPTRVQPRLGEVLAARCGEDGRRALLAALRERLSVTEGVTLDDKVGAWLALLEATEHAPESFVPLAQEFWPEDAESRNALATEATRRGASRLWLWEQALRNPSWMSTTCFRSMSVSAKREEWATPHGTVTREQLRALGRVLDPPFGGEGSASLSSGAEMFSWSFPELSFGLGAVEALHTWRPAHSSWEVWCSLLPYLEAPGAVTLASGLRRIAVRVQPENWLIETGLPWPAAMCLAAASSPDELVDIAVRLERGELGDRAIWQAHEARWAKASLTPKDVGRLVDAVDILQAIFCEGASPPIDRESRVESSSWRDGIGVGELLRSVVARVAGARSQFVRCFLSWLVVLLLEFAWKANGTLDRTIEPEALAQALQVYDGSFPLHALIPLNLVQWPDAATRLIIQGVLQVGHYRWSSRREGEYLPLLTFAMRRLEQEPSIANTRFAALVVWACISWREEGVLRPTRAPDLPDAPPEVRWPLKALSGLMSAAEIDEWRAPLAAASSEWVLHHVFNTFLAVGSPREHVERLAVELAQAPRLNASVASYLNNWIEGALSRRKSQLRDPAVWLRLALPAPHPEDLPRAPEEGLDHDREIVRFESITLRNLRVHKDFSLGGPPPVNEKGQWLVLLGENGTGKTTLLRGIAMALCNASAAAAIPSQLAPEARMLSLKSPEGGCVVKLRDGRSFEATVQRQPTGSETVTQPSRERSRPWLVAYGCRRGPALGSAAPDRAAVSFDVIGNLFDNPPGLIHAGAWLEDLRRRSREDSPGQWAHLYDSAREALRRVLLGATEVAVSLEGVFVTFEGKEPLPLASLSDGYLTTAGWTADLMARWIRRCVDLKQEVPKDFNLSMRGVVLLDEIDLHLHPRWQEKVIKDVREVFPQMTFVVTTHNPVTLLGAERGEVFVLDDHEGDGRISARQIDIPPGTRVGQILTGPWFNRESELDFDTRDKLKEHQDMLLAGVAEDAAERVELERVLRERLGRFMDTSLERMAAHVAAEELRAMAPEPTADQRDHARKKIQERLRAKRGAPKNGA